MPARLSADTELIRAYGSAFSVQAADLRAVAARLTAQDTVSAAAFGPVGARFQAALARAAEGEAHRVAELSASAAAARTSAASVARAYTGADAEAGNRVTGGW